MDGKSIQTGILGGSFNPIHIGHLALANYLREYTQLDEIWFMVSPQNPFKSPDNLLSDEARLKLARIAIKDYPHFHVSDFEFHLPRPSYMVHTLQALRENYPERQFSLIIGSDNWKSFNQWYAYERIISENDILIYPRPHFEIPPNEKLPPHVSLIQAPLLDISSTFIRKSIKEGKDLRFFMPESVYTTIKQEKWYL